MKAKKLRIGKIPYANLFPIYYYLERKCDHSEYKFINGVPSSLNKMLRIGKIDVSPSSSIEYLRHKDKYSIIPWLSISASGPVSSIFLFSTLPLEALNKKTIAVSSHSETSAVLLKIILMDFLSLNCRFKTVNCGTLKKILTSSPACLLIGDKAMKEAKRLSSVTGHRPNPPSPPFTPLEGPAIYGGDDMRKILIPSRKGGVKAPSFLTGFTKGGKGGINNSSLYIYDLGDLWFKHTGLPFVFALWMVREKSLLQKNELIKKLSFDLIKAKEYASKKPSLIARHAPQKKWLSVKELVSYWKGISYDFTDKHMEGLRLFEKYAIKTHMSD